MTRRSICSGFLSVWAFCCTPIESGAQRIDDPRLAPRAVVRVTYSNGRTLVGRYEGATPDALRVRYRCDDGECDSLTTTGWNDVRQLDVQVHRPGSPQRAVVGAVVGAATTYLAIYLVASADQCSGEMCGLGYAVVGPPLVVLGGALGGVVGWTGSRYRWHRVWPPPEP